MGAVHVTVTIRNPAEPLRSWEGLFLVDTGATDSLAPRSRLEAIGLESKGLRVYETGDGRKVKMDVTTADIEFMGDFTAGRILMGDDDAEPLLGATALESAGIEVDPVDQRLKKLPALRLKRFRRWGTGTGSTARSSRDVGGVPERQSSDDERKEAANFVARLAAYEPDAATVGEAGKRIRALHDGRAPKVLDLFVGGGAIPLEAARLGCESHAFDYNPVAHLIELCTLVYPQTFGPDLANDFQRWSEVVLDRQRREIGDLYPAVEIPRTRDVSRQSQLFAGGDPPTARQAEPVAYIWARTVPCRRPGCTAPVPRRKPASTCPGWRMASSNRSGSSG